MLSQTLSNVKNMFTEENYKMGQEDLSPREISISNPTGFCLNCNSKIKDRYFCNKDCESTYKIKQNIKETLIPNLEEEIDTLISDKQNIQINTNYKTNYDKFENLIKGKELLLKKYKKEVGLIDTSEHPNAIPILKKGGKKTKKRKRSQKYKKSIKKNIKKYKKN
jgi:hypothetical protein